MTRPSQTARSGYPAKAKRRTSSKARGRREDGSVPERVRVWVSELLVSEAVATKVTGRHGIVVADVEAALRDLRGISGRWDDHPKRGLRVYADVAIGESTVRVVLYPVESPHGDRWALATAYRMRP